MRNRKTPVILAILIFGTCAGASAATGFQQSKGIRSMHMTHPIRFLFLQHRSHKSALAFLSAFLRPRYQSMSSPFVLVKVISGRLATGHGIVRTRNTIGSQAPGSWLRKSAIYGRQVGGAGAKALMSFMKVIGARSWVSTAA